MLKADGVAVIFTPSLIRERIGEVYWKIRHYLFKDKVPHTDLHYGLIGRRSFELLLEKAGFSFEFEYADTTRPFLAKIPLLNRLVALNLLWKIKKT